LNTSKLYDDISILEQVAEGNEKAFSQLFHQWQPFLASHIYRISESKELTEEIVQDVFLKIWQSRELLSSINHFKSYLMVVAKNHTINAIKKVSKEFSNWEKWAAENKDEDKVEASPDMKQGFYSILDEAIDHLPKRQREVYLLHRHERLTYQQIANHLGIGKESVKTHIEQAVRNISSYVKENMALVIIFLFLKR